MLSEGQVPIVAYESGLIVERICPECHRFIKRGTCETNFLTEMPRFRGWRCAKHGEVSPYFWWREA